MAKARAIRDSQVKSRPESAECHETPTIPDRKTDELVFAFVGPVGSGVSYTNNKFQSAIESHYNYTSNKIKMSSLIESNAYKVDVTISGRDDAGRRRRDLQDGGTKLREKYGSDYVARLAIQNIAVDRLRNHGYSQSGDQTPMRAERRRRVHFIDALKNPEEAAILREVYGDAFWLIGVFAPEAVRKRRLEDAGMGDAVIAEIMRIDEHEAMSHGQRVRDTIQDADFFIRNDRSTADSLEATINRFLEILFAVRIHTPTGDEAAMYTAQAAAASSACLSRQVGAAIYNSVGELIGKGANDVPKYGGGLYSEDDRDEDHRCFRWKMGLCHNDDRKNKLYSAIFRELKEHLKDGESEDRVTQALRRTDVRNLIEYSRSVHAEMEAIISVARNNKSGLVGSTLYTTTYPCHNCARHIVASGIKTVVYVEPYPKSLALDLHHDAISIDEADSDSKVNFLQFEGVAPRNILRLFGNPGERKVDGKVREVARNGAHPITHAPLDGFSQREQIIVKELETMK